MQAGIAGKGGDSRVGRAGGVGPGNGGKKGGLVGLGVWDCQADGLVSQGTGQRH